MDSAHLPASLGRYQLLEPLGFGGMGVVLRAKDPELRREVAIKLVPDELRANSDAMERLRREAVVMARINHPNVVRVFDVGEQDGMYYYVMELLLGKSLEKRPADTPFDPKEFLGIFTPLADALDVVHRNGIVHRDIKPSNIFVGVPVRGAVLTDFGLTFAPDWERLTSSGIVVGTARYAAPEQMRGEPPNVLSDMFSLGASMVEYASGKPPFADYHGPELLAVRAEAVLPPLAKVAPAVPAPIAQIIDRCVRFQSVERFPSAGELHRALLRAGAAYDLSGAIFARAPSPVAPPPVPHALAKPVRRTTRAHSRAMTRAHWRLLALWLMLVATLVGLVLGVWLRRT
ncbi:MAG: serine/threonine protein kinase [Candidatus Riflebacteria bacterium]|nr:serine/threonine protein kinase [Candidatus Riflebacteria bacterium]